MILLTKVRCLSAYAHETRSPILDALHTNRLLNIEDKFFKRLARRLLSAESPLTLPPQAPPTPPPDSEAVDEAAAAKATDEETQILEREKWRQEMLMDFALFEASITRAQFLLQSNEHERQRYAQEKERILQTAERVREGNAQLRQRLQEAQQTLALRKSYDALAATITSNPELKPRNEQEAAIDKLHIEIAELERESQDYANTWRERREQFGRIVEEGETMLRLIRDEKEEAERQEGMDGVEDGATPRPDTNRSDTPKPIDDSSDVGGARAVDKALEVVKQSDRLDAPSSRSSRQTSPARTPASEPHNGVEDSAIIVPETENSGLEEGEQAEVVDTAERMDTT